MPGEQAEVRGVILAYILTHAQKGLCHLGAISWATGLVIVRVDIIWLFNRPGVAGAVL